MKVRNFGISLSMYNKHLDWIKICAMFNWFNVLQIHKQFAIRSRDKNGLKLYCEEDSICQLYTQEIIYWQTTLPLKVRLKKLSYAFSYTKRDRQFKKLLFKQPFRLTNPSIQYLYEHIINLFWSIMR